MSIAVANSEKLLGDSKEQPRRASTVEETLEMHLAAASNVETPDAGLCLRIARSYMRLGNYTEAERWALAVTDAGDDFVSWHAAAGLLQSCANKVNLSPLRSARLALIGSYTTTQFALLLQLAARRLGIALDIYEGSYGQYRQEILDSQSKMYSFAPDLIVMAVHAGELGFSEFSVTPEEDIEAELKRWTMLWEATANHCKARIIQHNFALPPEAPMGHLGARLTGSRYMMTQLLNARLGEKASNAISIVDCERLSSLFGKEKWFDPKYWFLSKQAVALGALPLLARHTAAVIAADLGLSRKCVVLDLDNTLWGGVIGEDGLSGIKLGSGPEGEAFVAFQEYLLKLKSKGVILTVCSKNNEADAREPFEKHTEMRIRLDDIAVFVASWEEKSDQIRSIAETLNIGLESVVFVDDNPVERAAVRKLLPQVDVIPMPADPAQYARALSQYLLLETSSFTLEDGKRTEQYHAKAQIAALESSANSIEDFYRSLRMKAIVSPFNEIDLPRIAQLVGKTNQFNLTTRRYSLGELRTFVDDPACIHLSIQLRDCFANQGLVGVLIAFVDGDTLNIDTWLMSCRVIGRTVEAEMLRQLCKRAEQLGCTAIRGRYMPTAKNSLVKDVFAKFDFKLVDDQNGVTTWIYDLQQQGSIRNEFIETHEREEAAYGTA